MGYTYWENDVLVFNAYAKGWKVGISICAVHMLLKKHNLSCNEVITSVRECAPLFQHSAGKL